jgi:hypothetical protein
MVARAHRRVWCHDLLSEKRLNVAEWRWGERRRRRQAKADVGGWRTETHARLRCARSFTHVCWMLVVSFLLVVWVTDG